MYSCCAAKRGQASACDDATVDRSMRDVRPALSPDAARASLLASTALSATYPVAAKLIYAADGVALSPTALTALRFSLMAAGGALLLNVNADDESDTINQGFWLAAAELGFWATAGAQLNTAALQQISVVRGTILLASINILTPALSAMIGTTETQRRVPGRAWIACIIALASTIFALADGSLQVPTSLFMAGDEIMLGAATCYAIQQVRLSSLVALHAAPRLAAARLQTQAACSLTFLPFADGGLQQAWSSGIPALASFVSQISATQAGLISLSALAAVVGLLLQYEGQQVVPAPNAQPIYAASPILSACWAYLALSEPVSSSEALGGLGITTAALLAVSPSSKDE